MAEAGFDQAEHVPQVLDEEAGPRLVFADGTQSIYLADLSGDGLVDLARIRNGEVCYWPNLGYGRFGAKVTMDNAPRLDAPDLFDQQRIRLADIDGTGTTDLIYLGHATIDIYRNEAGNAWSQVEQLTHFPPIDNLSSVTVVDLLGSGTACLVWSSPLPGAIGQPMRYIKLMSEQKPHLLVKAVNNLGAETQVQYAPSTKFYLADKKKGQPWITRLPFPVHVVERVVTYDHISRNRFVTRYTYHHGYFDGIEREFRGFGRVEQWDTEEYATLEADGMLEDAGNLDAASHVPPVHTKSWFHTVAFIDRDHISDFFAGIGPGEGEYYREPGLDDEQAEAMLLPDTVLPPELKAEEEREACRALKGMMLRQEVYALDGTAKEPYPYLVTEQNFTIKQLQPKGDNRHGVFFSHAREAVSYHYERNPDDPRVSHTLALEVDGYGNVMKSASIAYGRRKDFTDVELAAEDRKKQRLIHITCTENTFTRPFDFDDSSGEAGPLAIDEPDAYRTPLPAESRTYELRQAQQEQSAHGQIDIFKFNDVLAKVMQAGDGEHDVSYEDLEFTRANEVVTNDPEQSEKYFRRLIEHVRTLYRPNNMGVDESDPLALLPLGTVQSLALPGESYNLAFTPGLLAQIYQRPRDGQPPENLLPDPDNVLPTNLASGQVADRGGYVHSEGDANWWIPSGRVYYHDDPNVPVAEELAAARQHFFLPRRFLDSFGNKTTIDYDDHDMLVVKTKDAVENTVAAINDYRILQPRLVTDPNRNRTAAAFDALGMLVATAVMGKEVEPDGIDKGDLLEDFDADPALANLQAFVANPHTQAASLLGKATTRIVYDLERYQRAGQPPFAATLARETHFHDPGGAQTKIQVSFSYSDGFGREIQQKIQAEAGDAPQRQDLVLLPSGDIRPGDLVRDAHGELVQANTPRRWVGSGRTVFNNKGKPIKQYEPFFSSTPLYEPEREMTDAGVTPIIFYDPLERVVATLHPNHTYEKVVFDPWRQTTWDVNDTVTISEPWNDAQEPDVADYFKRLLGEETDTYKSWYDQRKDGQLGESDQQAATKAAAHADTPTTAYFDTLGRPFLTVTHNKVICPDNSEEWNFSHKSSY